MSKVIVIRGANFGQNSLKHVDFIEGSATVALSVSPSGSGIVNGAGTYDVGTSVSISAIANDGYAFKKWSDNNVSNPRNIEINSNINLTAIFGTPTNITRATIMASPASEAFDSNSNEYRFLNAESAEVGTLWTSALSQNGARCVSLIDIEGYSTIAFMVFKTTSGYGNLFLDASKNIISEISNSTLETGEFLTCEIPANAKYFAYCISSSIYNNTSDSSTLVTLV